MLKLRVHPNALALSVSFFVIVGPALAQTQTLFFDDFTGPTPKPVYQAVLPSASYRFGCADSTYLGASGYSFQTVGSASVIRLGNQLSNLQRRGWSASA